MNNENTIVNEDNQEELDKLKEEVAKLNQEKSGLVEELKGERKVKQEALQKVTELETKLNPPDDVDAKVQSALAATRKEEAQKNKDVAIKRFQEENKSFHPDNDAGSIKWDALIKEFESFNTQGAHSVDEFNSYLNKAKRLIGKPDQSENIVSTDIISEGDGPKPIQTNKFFPPDKNA